MKLARWISSPSLYTPYLFHFYNSFWLNWIHYSGRKGPLNSFRKVRNMFLLVFFLMKHYKVDYFKNVIQMIFNYYKCIEMLIHFHKRQGYYSIHLFLPRIPTLRKWFLLIHSDSMLLRNNKTYGSITTASHQAWINEYQIIINCFFLAPFYRTIIHCWILISILCLQPRTSL